MKPHYTERGYNLPNQDLFNEWTETSAYLLGLLYADGHNNGRTIVLVSTDKQLIDLVVDLTSYKGTITTRSAIDTRKTAYWLHFGGPVVNTLMRLGLPSGKKAFNLKWPKELIGHRYERDFLRGFFDGDGTAGSTTKGYHQPYLGFSSNSPDILNRIAQIARDLGCYNHQPQVHQMRFGITTILAFADPPSVSLLTMYMYLYPTTNMCLHRKRDTILKCFGINRLPLTEDRAPLYETL